MTVLSREPAGLAVAFACCHDDQMLSPTMFESTISQAAFESMVELQHRPLRVPHAYADCSLDLLASSTCKTTQIFSPDIMALITAPTLQHAFFPHSAPSAAPAFRGNSRTCLSTYPGGDRGQGGRRDYYGRHEAGASGSKQNTKAS